MKCSLWTERPRESQLIHLVSLPIHFFGIFCQKPFYEIFLTRFRPNFPNQMRDPRTETSRQCFQNAWIVLKWDQNFSEILGPGSNQPVEGSNQIFQNFQNFQTSVGIAQNRKSLMVDPDLTVRGFPSQTLIWLDQRWIYRMR